MVDDVGYIRGRMLQLQQDRIASGAGELCESLNRWQKHLNKYRQQHPSIPFRKAQQEAKKTFKSTANKRVKRSGSKTPKRKITKRKTTKTVKRKPSKSKTLKTTKKRTTKKKVASKKKYIPIALRGNGLMAGGCGGSFCPHCGSELQ